jgi:hypothetical protein
VPVLRDERRRRRLLLAPHVQRLAELHEQLLRAVLAVLRLLMACTPRAPIR